jgi:hypothetical protein
MKYFIAVLKQAHSSGEKSIRALFRCRGMIYDNFSRSIRAILLLLKKPLSAMNTTPPFAYTQRHGFHIGDIENSFLKHLFPSHL